MSRRKQQSNIETNDQTTNDAMHDAHISTRDQHVANDQRVDTHASFVSLKQIIVDRKIKTDPKLIRRVLRKYYASKINHQLRDAWMFDVASIDDVVSLIDTHCRANKSQNDVQK